MGKKLVIAEKPMLAKAILDAIPGTAKSIKAGERVFYTEKGDYLVVALLDLCGFSVRMDWKFTRGYQNRNQSAVKDEVLAKCKKNGLRTMGKSQKIS